MMEDPTALSSYVEMPPSSSHGDGFARLMNELAEQQKDYSQMDLYLSTMVEGDDVRDDGGYGDDGEVYGSDDRMISWYDNTLNTSV